MKPIRRWGAMWYSKSKRGGVHTYLIYRDSIPVLFNTRAKARAFIKEEYGYIKTRKDLRIEPHGWRMPRPVRVEVQAITGWNKK